MDPNKPQMPPMPPPPPNPSDPGVGYDEPVEFTDSPGGASQPIEDIFNGYDDGQRQGQEQEQPQEANQEEYNTPNIQMSPNIITVAGVIGLVIVVFLTLKIGTSKFKNYRNNREYNIKMNSTADTSHLDFTNSNEDGGIVDITNREESDDGITSPINKKGKSNRTGGEVITEVARYQKSVSEDNRTTLYLEVEEYGNYDIYVSRRQYDALEDKGYILVDMEMINKKVNYVFISNKQENFKDILEGK